MARLRLPLSTGLPSLDHLFRGLMPGDNIVWQVDTIQDYKPFVQPYVSHAREHRQKLFYFRFADHEPLTTEAEGATVVTLDPNRGFEPFITSIHRVISGEGRGCLYLFDCLSVLAPDWCSDRMLGNFFLLTCPFLYDRAAIAYFAILRNFHSFHALRPIASTTQILVDVYRHEGRLYIQPNKVQYRYSPTMHLLHAWEEDGRFVPLTQSGRIAQILAGAPWSHSETASAPLGFWTKSFAMAQFAQDEFDRGRGSAEEVHTWFRRLLPMLISREPRILAIAERYLTLNDLLAIRRRMIGTGRIGGKAVGMLLAQAILRKANPDRWGRLLEPHDSFFVGADVFYTYLVQNGCWWMIFRHEQTQGPDDEMETARRRIQAGDFPDYIVRQFADMLDYFGPSPIIVRSSSLLEDNFGHAFAGKYDSVFCANQGGPHKRLEDFLFAVRTVYASTLSEEALAYRQSRGFLTRDEQMALLIQRVSGNTCGRFFFPHAAGVALSFNPYVWHPDIAPEAGLLRLVFGMGTRAVDRADDDYTRLVALNAPLRQPGGTASGKQVRAQRRVDVLDLEANHLTPVNFGDILAQRPPEIPFPLFVSEDRAYARELRDAGHAAAPAPLRLTFEGLLSRTSFVPDMRDLLRTLQEAYQYPVDVEFTLNFIAPDRYQINVVQCRPLQVRGIGEARGDPPERLPPSHLLFESRGAVIGNSAEWPIAWILYVAPERYAALKESDQHAMARLIGEVLRHSDLAGAPVLLLGPGRWGTTTSALGVPVRFSDIAPAAAIGEIVALHDRLIPEVSLGTHFFNELVERDMLYVALVPGRPGHFLNTSFFDNAEADRFPALFPHHAEWAGVIRLFDTRPESGLGPVILNANVLRQRAVCYRVPAVSPPPV